MLAMFDEKIDEWMIHGLEHTGNIVKKNKKPEEADMGQQMIEL